MMHVSDISWTQRLSHPSEIFKVGDPVEAIVILLDQEGQGVSLSVKNLSENPWDNIQEKFGVLLQNYLAASMGSFTPVRCRTSGSMGPKVSWYWGNK
jgi:predicted RNA-binding protein with RPS1 domain